MDVRSALVKASSCIVRRDAEVLLAHVLCCERAYLLAHPEAELAAEQVRAFQSLVERRVAQEPLQYLTGQQEFFGLELRVTAATLIPRPETELLVEAVLEFAATLPTTPRIVDVGTGSGAIALALAKHIPTAHVTAVDLSAEALEVACANAGSLGLAQRIRFLQSDLLSAFGDERFEVIVSNPPYVATADAATMGAEVVEHEPHGALFAGADGLDVYRRLIPAAHAALVPGGLLAMEFGFGQRDAIRALLAGWQSIRFIDDYAGIPRVALAQRATSSRR